MNRQIWSARKAIDLPLPPLWEREDMAEDLGVSEPLRLALLNQAPKKALKLVCTSMPQLTFALMVLVFHLHQI